MRMVLDSSHQNAYCRADHIDIQQTQNPKREFVHKSCFSPGISLEELQHVLLKTCIIDNCRIQASVKMVCRLLRTFVSHPFSSGSIWNIFCSSYTKRQKSPPDHPLSFQINWDWNKLCIYYATPVIQNSPFSLCTEKTASLFQKVPFISGEYVTMEEFPTLPSGVTNLQSLSHPLPTTGTLGARWG